MQAGYILVGLIGLDWLSECLGVLFPQIDDSDVNNDIEEDREPHRNVENNREELIVSEAELRVLLIVKWITESDWSLLDRDPAEVLVRRVGTEER